MKVLKILKKPAVLGWLLWFITTLLLAGPAVMLMYRITYDTANALTRIVSGVFGAAIFSGVLVTLGNEIWFRIRRKQLAQAKKENRRAKKKSGKKK
ncbi:MAG TPA: hypothetical protein PLZ53_08905 [Candidatus Hydrogenedentes bacterium]|jgi:hypothetical protein|nr:MAG: hypothetical protein BWY07_01869 [Candidatus Hydrogenedentes bacterium ADurb.Bin170]HNZ48718.1 hypothetical protein [Candidatus Hydrogenedentota bacterium]HOD95238.1 hypothetical protein [Candidatus Hydrogenedentota bacterium]HOH43226.1 hypothetical protein [Candidatus Hydrogenedentota bacterium]HOM47656.1 hypothetical protein [Candidatus Hydrogenedentota bacterium]